ncbi:MAG: hypothetical protein JW891_01480, partial [Candidatus Lokiarchaeota archaeon]|nr:hypothetical protein [Candidatus Lokiarchaeota archaeon]
SRNFMSEEPQFPPLPDIGEVLERKKKLVERVTTVLKCNSCRAKYERLFTPGDYTFKNLYDEKCSKCSKIGTLNITEIYCEWIDPNKIK